MRHYRLSFFSSILASLHTACSWAVSRIAGIALTAAAIIAPAAYAMPLPAFEPVTHSVVSEADRKASLTAVKASGAFRLAGAKYRHGAGTATL